MNQLADRVEQTMHRDRCTILRGGQETDAFGISQPIDPVPVYRDIPCKVNRKALSNLQQGDTVARVSYQLSVYLHPRYRVLEGDELHCTMWDGTEVRLEAGAVFPYQTNTVVVAAGEVTP